MLQMFSSVLYLLLICSGRKCSSTLREGLYSKVGNDYYCFTHAPKSVGTTGASNAVGGKQEGRDQKQLQLNEEQQKVAEEAERSTQILFST